MGTTAEKLAYLADTKTAIKDAIISNGIDVPDDTTFRGYPDKVNQIIGQFDATLDEIIGGEIVPVLDIEKRLATVNGISGDINTQLDTLDATKLEIATAITEKGIEIPEGTPFGDYADLIALIETGLSDGDLAKATATVEDVIAGKTFYAGNRELKTGTAQGGLTLKMQYTGIISPSNSLTVKIKSKTFLAIGNGYISNMNAILPLCVYIVDGSKVVSSGLSVSVSYSDLGDGLKLIFSSSYYIVDFNGDSVDGYFPLLIFEG